jgi:hypothetical protein
MDASALMQAGCESLALLRPANGRLHVVVRCHPSVAAYVGVEKSRSTDSTLL